MDHLVLCRHLTKPVIALALEHPHFKPEISSASWTGLDCPSHIDGAEPRANVKSDWNMRLAQDAVDGCKQRTTTLFAWERLEVRTFQSQSPRPTTISGGAAEAVFGPLKQ